MAVMPRLQQTEAARGRCSCSREGSPAPAGGDTRLCLTWKMAKKLPAMCLIELHCGCLQCAFLIRACLNCTYRKHAYLQAYMQRQNWTNSTELPISILRIVYSCYVLIQLHTCLIMYLLHIDHISNQLNAVPGIDAATT